MSVQVKVMVQGGISDTKLSTMSLLNKMLKSIAN